MRDTRRDGANWFGTNVRPKYDFALIQLPNSQEVRVSDAVLAALVAGVISFAGVAANLYIARRGRESDAEHLRLSSRLKIDEEAVTTLKDYAREIERSRVALWHLRAEARQVLERPIYPDRLSALLDLQAPTRSQLDRLFEKWADVKSDIPDGAITFIRARRHECRGLGRLTEHMDVIREEIAGAADPESLRDWIERLDTMAKRLLLLLDELFDAVVSVIRQLTGETLISRNLSVHQTEQNDLLASKRNAG